MLETQYKTRLGDAQISSLLFFIALRNPSTTHPISLIHKAFIGTATALIWYRGSQSRQQWRIAWDQRIQQLRQASSHQDQQVFKIYQAHLYGDPERRSKAPWMQTTTPNFTTTLNFQSKLQRKKNFPTRKEKKIKKLMVYNCSWKRIRNLQKFNLFRMTRLGTFNEPCQATRIHPSALELYWQQGFNTVGDRFVIEILPELKQIVCSHHGSIQLSSQVSVWILCRLLWAVIRTRSADSSNFMICLWQHCFKRLVQCAPSYLIIWMRTALHCGVTFHQVYPLLVQFTPRDSLLWLLALRFTCREKSHLQQWMKTTPIHKISPVIWMQVAIRLYRQRDAEQLKEWLSLIPRKWRPWLKRCIRNCMKRNHKR